MILKIKQSDIKRHLNKIALKTTPAPDASFPIEYFRSIYLSLQADEKNDFPRVLGITSAVRAEGRTTIAIGLAGALAMYKDSSVILVEADFDNPVFAETFGIPAEPGLSDWLNKKCEVNEALHQMGENLYVLPAGRVGNEAARLTRMLSRCDIKKSIGGDEAHIIMDLPAVTSVSYGPIASAIPEAVLLVVRWGLVTTKSLKETFKRLDEKKLLGTVLNGTQSALPEWLEGYLI